MAALDQAMQTVMQQYDVQGGSLAVSYQGRLVFARGYGCANMNSNTPVQPDSLFRFASVSKTFTAIGIMQLVQQGKLSLNATVFGPNGLLSDYTPLPKTPHTPGLSQITVQNLLEHTGGWDRSTTENTLTASHTMRQRLVGQRGRTSEWSSGAGHQVRT